jgi:WD40 repeat protein
MWFGRTGTKVTAIGFTPDGRTMYTGGDAGELRAWDVVTRSFTDLPALALGRLRDIWESDTRIRHIWPLGGRLVADTWTSVQVLDCATNEWAEPLTDPPLHCPTLSADGATVAECRGGSVQFRDTRTNQELPVPPEVAATEKATLAAFTADGSGLLLYSSATGRAKVWDIPSAKMRCELTPPPTVIQPWALSRDGKTAVISCRSKMLVYDLTSGRLRCAPVNRATHGHFALDPTGRTLAAASLAAHGVVGLWDLDAGRLRERFAWRVGRLSALEFSPDGLTCAAGGETGVVVWDV